MNLNSIVLGEGEVLIHRYLSIVWGVGLVKKACESWGHKYFFKCISSIIEYSTCLTKKFLQVYFKYHWIFDMSATETERKGWFKTTKIFSVMMHDCDICHPDGFCCPSAFWQSPRPSWKRTLLQWTFSS